MSLPCGRVIVAYSLNVSDNTIVSLSLIDITINNSIREKNSDVICNVPRVCNNFSYTGETHQKLDTQRKERQDKARLKIQDNDSGKSDSTSTRLNTKDELLDR